MKKEQKASKVILNRESLHRLDPDRLSGARGADGPKPTTGQISIDICTVAADGCA